jgi:hypothetical protein
MFSLCVFYFTKRVKICIHTRNGNAIGMSYSSPIIALPRPCDPTKVLFSIIDFDSSFDYSEFCYYS